ncbi:MAG: molybdate ABC transporter substrate-binding protein [Gammaproteobacteria bacterium]|nr:molybdate ABC transporter substrate-binding protein [Gammaproteobacteria bacterium]
MGLLWLGSAQADITVFAAASTKNALDQLAVEFEAQSETKIYRSYAGSAVLARQISLGAPADIFISANREWTDWLLSKTKGQQFNLVANRLVMIAPTDHLLAPFSNIELVASQLSAQRWATGMVDSVPAGMYAKAALQSLGQWETLKPNLVQTDNVRSSLALVARKEVAFGVVYQSDVVAEPAVQTIYQFAKDTHSPIIYPLVRLTDSAEVAAFVAFLQSGDARMVFAEHGFEPLP